MNPSVNYKNLLFILPIFFFKCAISSPPVSVFKSEGLKFQGEKIAIVEITGYNSQQIENELSIYLLEDGFRKDEIIIQSIGSGDIIEISLSWNPSTVGEKLLTISLDPLDDIQENNESDNDISIIESGPSSKSNESQLKRE